MASKELAKFPGGLQGLDWPGARGFYPTIGWPSFFQEKVGNNKDNKASGLCELS